MLRMLLVFLVVFAIFYFGLTFIGQLTKQEKLSLVKKTLWSLFCAVLASVVLVALVIFF